jgi:alkanesulfonate monooxygenase SsuD/methylene tetrahydromethanopterin reductase-like flavin-dependent oxidoreductase (luciferase family)
LYCAKTEAAARAAAVEYMDGYYRDAERHYHWEDIGTVRGYEHYQARTKESFERRLRNHEYLDYSVWGTPAMCVDQIRHLQAMTDLGTLLLNVRYGPMPIDVAEQSIRCFAEEALGELRERETPLPAI